MHIYHINLSGDWNFFKYYNFSQLMLKTAFKKAIIGRRCTICSKYVSHAYYLRHRDECQLADDDDDLCVVAEFINHYGPINDVSKKLETEEIQTQYPTTSRDQHSQDVCQAAEDDNDLCLVEEFIDNYDHRSDMFENLEANENQTQYPTTSSAAATTTVCRCEFEFVEERAYTESVLMDKPLKRVLFSGIVGELGMQQIVHDSDKNNSRLPCFSVKKEITVVEVLDSSGDGEPPAKRRSSFDSGAYGLDASSAYDCLITRLNFLYSEYRYDGGATQSQQPQLSSEDFQSQQNSLSEDFHHSMEVETQQHVDEEVESSLLNVEEEPLSVDDHVHVPVASDRSQIGVHHSVEFFWQIALKVLRRTNSAMDKKDSIAFWRAENIINLLTLFSSSVEAQQVFMKLLMFRRRWLPLSKIKVSHVVDVEPFMKELVSFNLVEEGGAERDELCVQDCFNYLTVPELLKLSKKFKLKCNNINRKELVDQLLRMGGQRNVFNKSIGSIIKKSVFDFTGNFYLLSERMQHLCHAMLTLYAPTAMDTSALIDDPRVNLAQQLFYNMLQLKTKRLILPGPPSECIKLISVFTTYDDLLSYVKSKYVEESILRFNGHAKNVEEMVDAIQELKDRLTAYLADEERISFYRRLQPYMRKFTTPRVFIRCIHHYTEALQRLRAYEEADQLLEYLLESVEVRLFCDGHQLSVWYDRRSLVLDAHLKRHELALAVCVAGLRESEMPDVGALALQARAQRLIGANSSLTVNYCVPFVQCTEPKYITIEGLVLGKNLGDQRANHFYLPAQSTADAELIRPCTVEMIVLNHFLNHRGFNEGMHAEGAIWHTVFGLLCYDVIFDHQINDVWFSELQTHPCDLNSKEFYVNRMRQFDAVFDELLSAHPGEAIYGRVLRTYTKFKHSTNSEINLTLFRDVRHIMDFLICCTPSLLVAVFRRLVENYRKNRSGFPDLTVWNTENRTLAVVEVKGPNDRLSNKQRLWLDFFVGEGVEAYVCNVKARKCRALQ